MAIHLLSDLQHLINDTSAPTTSAPPAGPIEFYSAVAQIIPVLLLAYLLQIPYHRGKLGSRGIALSWFNMVLVMTTEVIAVAATFRRGHLPLWLTCIVWAGLATPLACLAVLLDQRIRHPERYAPQQSVPPPSNPTGGTAP